MQPKKSLLSNAGLMWALLFLFPPAGILLVWLNKSYPKYLKVVLSLVSAAWLVFILLPKGNTPVPAASLQQPSVPPAIMATVTSAPTAATPSPSPSPTTTPKPTSVVLQDFSKMELTEENVMSVLSPAFAAGQLKSVDIEKNSKGKGYIVDVVFNLDDVVASAKEAEAELTLVQQSAIKSEIILAALLPHTKVDKVWAWTEITMVDQNGKTELQTVINVSMTKETAKKIEWSTFTGKVAENYKMLHDSADSVFIYPTILEKLK